MVLMMIIRYISAVLVWILTSLVVLGSLGEVISCLLLPGAASGLRSPPVSVLCLSGDQRPLVALHRPPSLCQRHVRQDEDGLQG